MYSTARFKLDACVHLRVLAQFYLEHCKEARVHGFFTCMHDLASSVHTGTEITLRAYSQALARAYIIMLDESLSHNLHNRHSPLL